MRKNIRLSSLHHLVWLVVVQLLVYRAFTEGWPTSDETMHECCSVEHAKNVLVVLETVERLQTGENCVRRDIAVGGRGYQIFRA